MRKQLRRSENGLHATHQARQVDWEEYLSTLDTSVEPRLVITDGNPAITGAVRAAWPAAPALGQLPRPSLACCEHHLHVNGIEAMEGDLIGGWAHPLHRRLDTAFLRAASCCATSAASTSPSG